MAATSFHNLKTVSQPTLDILQQLKLTTPTPVQTVVIPLFTGNQDVAVEACTGSGKTLSFVIPVTERLRSLEEALLPHQVMCMLVWVMPMAHANRQALGVGWRYYCFPHQRACWADTRRGSALSQLCSWGYFAAACRRHVSCTAVCVTLHSFAMYLVLCCVFCDCCCAKSRLSGNS